MVNCSVDLGELRRWIGRSESHADRVAPTPIAALAATLDRDEPFPRDGDAVPPLWHWLYFLPIHRASELGPDGHARRGGFLPPVELPRRMFAGGRFRFERPLRVGEAIARHSRIADVSYKEGRSGPLVFVLVRHEISGSDGLALVEEHDIVYRGAAIPGTSGSDPQRPSADPIWRNDKRADDVLLFRYSALTFNGHRIHYDRRYVTEVEGYPGLVVHGPLIATMLLELQRRNLPGAVVTEFSFRAVRPLFDVAPFSVCGRAETPTSIRLWAMDDTGALAMDASATLA
jgi:3-methylfumaryl-CoA hydratase